MKHRNKLTPRQIEKLKKKRRQYKPFRVVILAMGLVFAISTISLAVKGISKLFASDEQNIKLVDKQDNNVSRNLDTTVDVDVEKDEVSDNNLDDTVNQIDDNNKETKVVEDEKIEDTKNELEDDNSLLISGEIKEDKLIKNIENPYTDFNISEEKEEEIIDNLPSSLVEKVTNYPESKKAVLQYEKYIDSDNKIDIEEDLEKSKKFDREVKLPYFNQWDVRWGFKEVAGEFVSYSGCGPTALSSIYTGLTGDTSLNPYEMAKYTNEQGWYDASGGYPALFVGGPKSLGLDAERIETSKEAMKQAIDENKIVVSLVLENGIGDFTRGGHFIIITEYDDEDRLTIYDPNSYENTNKKWDIDRVMAQSKTFYSIWK